MRTLFPIGARVYLDKSHAAIVRDSFPEGSTSHHFPHYKIDVVGGDKNVAVRLDRVGVVKAVRQ